MHVIGHHDGNPQVELLSIVMQAAVQHDGANALWQDPSVVVQNVTKCCRSST